MIKTKGPVVLRQYSSSFEQFFVNLYKFHKNEIKGNNLKISQGNVMVLIYVTVYNGFHLFMQFEEIHL